MNVKEFYAEDDRRRRSDEITYGTGWRDDSDAAAEYAVRWIVETGEVYALRNPAPPFPVLFDPEAGVGMAPLKTDVYAVKILGRVQDAEALQAALNGWEDHVRDASGLMWIRERLTSATPAS
jgi:hypothetical protein